MDNMSRWNWQKENWPNWQYDEEQLIDLERQFLLNSGRLLGAWQHLEDDTQKQLVVSVLSDEAMKTSAIEGEYLDRASVQSSIRRGFGMVSDKRAGAQEAGMADLMLATYHGFNAPISHDLLFSWHALICAGRRDLGVIGGYRSHEDTMQVVSGPTYAPVVHFEAPPSGQVHSEMTRFIGWVNSTSMPALAKAGIVHLYFVSIHPFEDGNGRIARALCEQSLAQSLGQSSLLAMSRQIELDRKAYYQELETHNKGMDITGWLLWFARTALAAQKYSLDLVDHLISKTKLLDRLRGQMNPRQEKVLLRLFEAGPDGFKGGLSAKNYMTISGASPATARRDLGDLVAMGALTRTGDRKTTRYWLQRAGRQSGDRACA